MEKFDFTFYNLEKTMAEKPFLRQPFGDRWETWTYAEVGQMARKMANALKSLGLPPKSHIGLVSKNCREWIVADLAIVMAGYVSVPFFPTLTGAQIAEVLRLGDVKALFVGKMEVWEDMKAGVPDDMPIIAFPHYKGNSKVEEGHQWEDLMEKFEPIQETAALDLDDIWTIIFTSGTTGTPKGVVLTYRVFDAADTPTRTTNPLKVDLQGNNRLFSYLPLNHIAERVIVEGCTIRYGGEVWFTESLETFAKNLSEAKPTIFFGVPRIYTKFQQAILAKISQKKLNTLLKIPIVSGIIKKKLQTALGLHEAKVWVSGAAALPEATKEWYRKIGINITNGYGMTENCAICTLLDGNIDKPGSVGKPQPGVKLKIDEDTGEILMSGPYVMSGYYKDPEKTAEVIIDGWLHTGDQGYIDEEGYLFITGRVKDTFKTAKGKYIIPGPIEWGFGTNNDIEQLCLVGLACPQPILLINISEIGAAKSREELVSSLESTLNKVNADLPNYQKVSKIIVAKDAWSVENGLLTPTLKVKRGKINEKYGEALEAWQNTAETIVFE